MNTHLYTHITQPRETTEFYFIHPLVPVRVEVANYVNTQYNYIFMHTYLCTYMTPPHEMTEFDFIHHFVLISVEMGKFLPKPVLGAMQVHVFEH